jgi:hypothetical protein
LEEGEGARGANVHPQYSFKLGIVFVVTKLNKGSQKEEKKKMKNLRYIGTIFPSIKFDSFVK